MHTQRFFPEGLWFRRYFHAWLTPLFSSDRYKQSANKNGPENPSCPNSLIGNFLARYEIIGVWNHASSSVKITQQQSP